jgi:hypothetical protein
MFAVTRAVKMKITFVVIWVTRTPYEMTKIRILKNVVHDLSSGRYKNKIR